MNGGIRIAIENLPEADLGVGRVKGSKVDVPIMSQPVLWVIKTN